MNNNIKKINNILSKLLKRIETSLDNGNGISSSDIDAFQCLAQYKESALYNASIVKKLIDKKSKV